MNQWPAAIFFDFDGVIVNSEPVHFAAFQHVLSQEGIHIQEPEYYAELIGFDDRGAMRHIFGKYNRPMDADTWQRVLRGKKETTRNLLLQGTFSALPGVDALVRQLAGRYPLAICSGALRDEIELMLDGIKLREFFPTIVAAEDVDKGKPDPSCYLLTAKLVQERTGRQFSPADCLIIEDAPSVIRSVKTKGFKTLGVANSYPLQELAHADWAVTDLEPATVMSKIPGLLKG